MDRKQLKKIKEDLNAFIQNMNSSDYKLDYACLIPAFEHEFNSPLILQVNAEWVKGMDCSVAIPIVVDYLFRNTSEDTREKIYRVDIYDESGNWHCTSQEYVLLGEMPSVF